MNENDCLSRMKAPGQVRPSKPYRGGVIQIWVTRACDKACFHCTQGSNLGGLPGAVTPEQFRTACRSLEGYFGVVGMFGGNPAVHKDFAELCAIMREEVPAVQRGLWCNNPITVENARIMRETFNPAYSNLNVHLDQKAYDLFKEGWPECNPVGLTQDSRHSPVFLAMKDVIEDEAERWELISNCDINQHWSAMVGVFRGELRAWFCEVAGAQAMLHQHEAGYPDTGINPSLVWYWQDVPTMRWVPMNPDEGPGGVKWWDLPMTAFAHQVRKHCHECGVPLRGYGELAMSKDGIEQTSATHEAIYRPKRKSRQVEVVNDLVQIEMGKLATGKVTRYLQNV